MDSPGDWTATALFSPSKARAQQAQARDWASVESWLAKHYGKRLPSFERNEDTLQALLSLATLNEDADEQRSWIEKVQKSAISAQTTRQQGCSELHHRLGDALDKDARESLNAVAGANIVLGSGSLVAMCDRFCELIAQRFELSEQVKRTNAQGDALMTEQARLGQVMEAMRADHFQAPHNVLEQTAEWTRSTKQLKAKLAEYDERLGALRSVASPSPTLEDVSRQTTENDTLHNRMRMLKTKLSAFNDLPSDSKAARVKLEDARKDLRDMTVKRDQLFEHLSGTG